MSLSSPYVIETHGLSKAYKTIQALSSLDLKVHQNSIFGFLGPNGAGKTTTIKLMLGLTRPTAGNANIFGMDSVTHSVAIRVTHWLPAAGTSFLRIHDCPPDTALYRRIFLQGTQESYRRPGG